MNNRYYRSKINMVFVICILLVCFVPVNAASDQYFSIAGAHIGSTAYQWAAGMADVIGKSVPGIKVTAEETKGYMENLRLLMDGSVEAGFTHSGLAYQAFLGEGNFKGSPKGRFFGWLGMPAMLMQVYTIESNNILRLDDLSGKRVGVGQVGGSSFVDTAALLKVTGLDNKIKQFKVRIAEESSMLGDGQLDAAIWCGTPPMPAVLEVCVKRKVVFVPIPDSVITKITSKYPYYYKTALPANTYPGQSTPIQTFAVQVAGLLGSDVPEDIAYKATKAIFENLDQLGYVHKAFKYISKETVLQGLSIPLHPGVLRYYREIEVPGIEDYVAKTKKLW